MKNNDNIPQEEKWKAVVNCDRKFDGLFYYAVKTTGIVCKPSCRAKTPIRENTLFFYNISEAVKNGFRPCKRCRPDITEYNYEPNRDLLLSVKEKFNTNCNEPLDLKAISYEFGISTSHLTRLFKEFYGLSPLQYITKLRVAKAAELLRTSDIDIVEIAYTTGFKSLSNFYRNFKEQLGHTPKEHRKNSGDCRKFPG